LQGFERLEDDLNLYYTTFYERHGLQKAMGYDLLETPEKRRFIYLGAHGSKREIGTDAGTIHLTTVSEFINALCRITRDVEGVILSCCNTGSSEQQLADLFRNNNLRWVLAYRYSVDWLSSLNLELFVLRELMNIEEELTGDRDTIVAGFRNALTLYNKNCLFAEDNNERPRTLEETLVLKIRPKFGKKVQTVQMGEIFEDVQTEDIFEDDD
jgi:hypothetical protein